MPWKCFSPPSVGTTWAEGNQWAGGGGVPTVPAQIALMLVIFSHLEIKELSISLPLPLNFRVPNPAAGTLECPTPWKWSLSSKENWDAQLVGSPWAPGPLGWYPLNTPPCTRTINLLSGGWELAQLPCSWALGSVRSQNPGPTVSVPGAFSLAPSSPLALPPSHRQL